MIQLNSFYSTYCHLDGHTSIATEQRPIHSSGGVLSIDFCSNPTPGGPHRERARIAASLQAHGKMYGLAGDRRKNMRNTEQVCINLFAIWPTPSSKSVYGVLWSSLSQRSV